MGRLTELERYRALRNTSVPTHKYGLGAHVLHRVGTRSEKTSFKVVRLLPDSGEGLQYRIKAERDGHERVVTESVLETIR